MISWTRRCILCDEWLIGLVPGFKGNVASVMVHRSSSLVVSESTESTERYLAQISEVVPIAAVPCKWRYGKH